MNIINDQSIELSAKVLVTGGAGFIGSHISEALTKRCYEVTVLDDLSSGKIENIRSLIAQQKIEFIQGSITDIKLLQQLCKGTRYVFHLAAIASVPRSIEMPEITHVINTTGTLNVLLAARDNGVSQVIYSSSSSVYGDSPILPKTETMIPDPQSPYAVTKLTGEYYCSVFQRVFNLRTTVLRYFNVYGIRQDPYSQYAAVIPKFIDSIRHNNPPIIYGNGEQTRDFIFVDDVAAINILCAEKELTGIINVGQGQQTSLNELSQLILLTMQSNLKPTYVQPRRGDIIHSVADISKLKSFGITPRYSLSQGIKVTIHS